MFHLLLLALTYFPTMPEGPLPPPDTLWMPDVEIQSQTQYMHMLIEIGDSLKQTQQHRARGYLDAAFAIAERYDDGRSIANILKIKGLTYYHEALYPPAIDQYRLSILKSREMGDSVQVANAMHNLSMAYREMGEYSKALEMAFEVLRHDEANKDERGMGYTLNNIGLLYENLGDSTQAQRYFKQALALRQRIGHIQGMAYSLVNIGNSYYHQKQLDSASYYYQKALIIFRAHNDIPSANSTVTNLGNIAYMKKDYDAAYEMYAQSLETAEQINDKTSAISAIINLGMVAKARGDYAKSRVSYEKAAGLSIEIGSDRQLQKVYWRFYELETTLGNFKEANEALNAYYQTRERLFDAEKAARIANVENQYALEKTALELEVMAKEKNVLQERERAFFITASLLAILLLLLTAGSLVAYLLNRKSLKAIALKNEELETLNKALDRFVYSASHDLRAPLLSVRGLIQLMRDEPNPVQLQHYLDLQDRSLTRLDTFICEILDYSRNSRTVVAYEPVSLHQLCQNAFAQISFNDTHKPVLNKIVVDESVPLYSDSQRLQIIINNLISNAVRYHHPYRQEPFVAVQARVSEHEAYIEIKDNGIGIPKEHHGRIFDMFYRAHNNGQGSGLGLFIVKEALSKLKGHITFHSEVDVGTTFMIRIPNGKSTKPVQESLVEAT